MSFLSDLDTHCRQMSANRYLILLFAGAIASCSLSPKPGDRSADKPRSSPIVHSPAGQQCMRELGAAGATFTPLPDRYPEKGCSNISTVQLSGVSADRASVLVTNLGPVTCEVGQAFAGWARFAVDRAAQQLFGSPVRSIETFGSYSCRNIAGSSRRSAHSTASAIDVAAFVLGDGRRITVKSGWNGNAAEREFLRIIQSSACRRFATVLGPDYNAAHKDHFHLEGVSSPSSNSYCR